MATSRRTACCRRCCDGGLSRGVRIADSLVKQRILTGMIHRPCYLVGHSAAKTRVNALLGPPSFPFPHRVRERSAERRWYPRHLVRRPRAVSPARTPPGAPQWRFSPRDRSSGSRTDEPYLASIQAALAPPFSP